jgi:hypothetical protein
MFTGDQFITTMADAVKRAQQDLLDHGIPITYMEASGRIVRRFPDGHLEEVEPYIKKAPIAAE